MACSTLTLTGINNRCKERSIGGIKEIYVAPYSTLAGVTISNGYAYPQLSNNLICTYKLRRNTGSLVSTLVQSDYVKGYYQNDLNIVFNKLDSAKRLEVIALAKSQIFVMVRDANGKIWFLGKDNYVEVSAATAATGTALSDANQYSLTLSNLSKQTPYEVEEETLQALLAGSSIIPPTGDENQGGDNGGNSGGDSTIVDVPQGIEVPTNSTPLTILATENNTEVTLGFCTKDEEAQNVTIGTVQPLYIGYSINDGSWTQTSFTKAGTTITLNAGDKLKLEGVGTTLRRGGIYMEYPTFTQTNGHLNANILFSKDCYVYGNIMSLLGESYSLGGTDYVNFTNVTSISEVYALYYLFAHNKHIQIPYDGANHWLLLPATTLSNSCYRGMFCGCNNLRNADIYLPATTLAMSCYESMFMGCSNLTTAPELPATTLADYCYSGMFINCENLAVAPELPATTLADGCYNTMFRGCGITMAPSLPATQLVSRCYVWMFLGCRKLNWVEVGFTIIQEDSLDSWLRQVNSTGTIVGMTSAATQYLQSLPTNSYSGIPSGWQII